MADFSTDFTTASNQELTAFNPGFAYFGASGVGLMVHGDDDNVRDQSEQGIDIWFAWTGEGAPTGNQRCAADVVVSNTGQAQGFVFVFGSGGGSPNGYNLWRENASTYQVYRRDAGTFTTIGSAISVSTTAGTPYRIEIEAENDTANNQTIIRYNINGTTGQVIDNSGSRLTGGYAGAGIYNPGSGPGNATVDNLQITDLAGEEAEPFNLVASAPIAVTGTVGVQGDIAIQVPVVFNLVPTAPIGINGVLTLLGDIDFTQLYWRIPTNAPNETPVNVIVFSGEGGSYAILAQADAVVDEEGNVDISGSGTPGAKAFALVHNYDDDPETESIMGGPAIATLVEV